LYEDGNTSAPVTIPVPDCDLDHGWCFVRRVLSDGEEVLETVPLTEADILDPQEEDVIPQRPIHEWATRDLINMPEMYYRQPPLYTVLHDLIMDWGACGFGKPLP